MAKSLLPGHATAAHYPYTEVGKPPRADRTVVGACPICFNSCPVTYHLDNGRLTTITGVESDPASASRSLALVALGLLGFAGVYLSGGLNRLPWDLRPGSPIGQSLGIAAALILLSTLYYLALRRSDGGRWGKPAAQALHGLAGTAGTALAILHSQAALRE